MPRCPPRLVLARHPGPLQIPAGLLALHHRRRGVHESLALPGLPPQPLVLRAQLLLRIWSVAALIHEGVVAEPELRVPRFGDHAQV